VAGGSVAAQARDRRRATPAGGCCPPPCDGSGWRSSERHQAVVLQAAVAGDGNSGGVWCGRVGSSAVSSSGHSGARAAF
jgi:hypothetical protein